MRLLIAWRHWPDSQLPSILGKVLCLLLRDQTVGRPKVEFLVLHTMPGWLHYRGYAGQSGRYLVAE